MRFARDVTKHRAFAKLPPSWIKHFFFSSLKPIEINLLYLWDVFLIRYFDSIIRSSDFFFTRFYEIYRFWRWRGERKFLSEKFISILDHNANFYHFSQYWQCFNSFDNFGILIFDILFYFFIPHVVRYFHRWYFNFRDF